MDNFISILVSYALITVFLRFVVFHIRRIVKIIQKFNLRKIKNRERLLLELNNLCPVPCYSSCCDLILPKPDNHIPFTHAESREFLHITDQAAVASHSIPKGI